MHLLVGTCAHSSLARINVVESMVTSLQRTAEKTPPLDPHEQDLAEGEEISKAFELAKERKMNGRTSRS